ncbi:MAG: hypothetical protein Q9160_006977 [Pyrenula sp. 1 TL-2023]
MTRFPEPLPLYGFLPRQDRGAGRHLSPSVREGDTLCIDQNNIPERNHQVQQMGHIFREAGYVIAWLGTSNPESDRFFDTMQVAYDLQAIDGSAFRDEILAHYTATEIEEFWKGLRNFCGSKYWTRAWIIQEVLLSRTLVVMYGVKQLPAWLLVDVLGYLSHLTGELSGDDKERLDRRRTFTKDRLSHAGKGRTMRTPLLDLLWHFGDQQCSDIRDRIYSLQAICEPQIDIDYNISTITLFSQVAEKLSYTTTEDLVLLSKVLNISYKDFGSSKLQRDKHFIRVRVENGLRQLFRETAEHLVLQRNLEPSRAESDDCSSDRLYSSLTQGCLEGAKFFLNLNAGIAIVNDRNHLSVSNGTSELILLTLDGELHHLLLGFAKIDDSCQPNSVHILTPSSPIIETLKANSLTSIDINTATVDLSFEEVGGCLKLSTSDDNGHWTFNTRRGTVPLAYQLPAVMQWSQLPCLLVRIKWCIYFLFSVAVRVLTFSRPYSRPLIGTRISTDEPLPPRNPAVRGGLRGDRMGVRSIYDRESVFDEEFSIDQRSIYDQRSIFY